MMRFMWISAMTTGLFCAGFAAVIDAITEQLSMLQVIVVALISGTLGSLFAQMMWGKSRK